MSVNWSMKEANVEVADELLVVLMAKVVVRLPPRLLSGAEMSTVETSNLCPGNFRLVRVTTT